jgi:SAM-dependent methyltransferase
MIYTTDNSEYLQKHPNWHTADSPWKAGHVLRILERNNLKPKTFVEVGCGAGEILSQLHQRFDDKTAQFTGYEISPDAFKMCLERQKERLDYSQENILEKSVYYDVLLMMDVFEHVDDYLSFIKVCGTKAKYKLYHIPLDMTVVSVLRNIPLKARFDLGHLHYFMKDTALATLKDCDQEIIDYFYTAGSIERNNNKLKTKILNIPRRILFAINPDLCVRLFGGYSLMVLTK